MYELKNSCFTTVVDGTELGPVYIIQLKPLKYEDHADEGATGASIANMTHFNININIQLNFFKCNVIRRREKRFEVICTSNLEMVT